MKSKTALAEYCASKVGCGYVLGMQGETLQDIISYYSKNVLGQSSNGVEEWLTSKQLDTIQFFDCSGLLVSFLLKENLIKYDMSADMLYKVSNRVNIPEIGDVGYLVKDNKAYHVGCVTAPNVITHALGTKKGVVAEPLGQRSWIFAKLPYFEDIKAEGQEFKVGDRLSIKEIMNGYTTSALAKKDGGSATKVKPAIYYVYKVTSDAVNVTRLKGYAGSWVNKEKLRRDSEWLY